MHYKLEYTCYPNDQNIHNIHKFDHFELFRNKEEICKFLKEQHDLNYIVHNDPNKIAQEVTVTASGSVIIGSFYNDNFDGIEVNKIYAEHNIIFKIVKNTDHIFHFQPQNNVYTMYYSNYPKLAAKLKNFENTIIFDNRLALCQFLSERLKVKCGEVYEDLQLKGASCICENFYSYSTYAEKNVVFLITTCNTCPFYYK